MSSAARTVVTQKITGPAITPTASGGHAADGSPGRWKSDGIARRASPSPIGGTPLPTTIADTTAPSHTVTAAAIAAASNDNRTVSIGDIDPDEGDTDAGELMPAMKPNIVHVNPHSTRNLLKNLGVNTHANAHLPRSGAYPSHRNANRR